MGSKLSRQVGRLVERNHRRLLLVGLDGAGKTTILCQIKHKRAESTIPTIGFTVETVKKGNLRLKLWDVGGQEYLRPYWRHHLTGTQGIIFVIDSADVERLELARDELYSLLSDEQLKFASILVLANKQDLPGAITTVEIKDILKLDNSLMRDKRIHIEETIATTGEGLESGLLWLCENMDTL